MKKILIGFTVITALLIVSCKKEKNYSQITDDSLISKGNERSSDKKINATLKPVIIYQASQSSLNNSSNAFIISHINQINSSTTQAKPGHYSIFNNSSSVLSSVIIYSQQCITSAPTVELTYQVTTIESVGATYGLTYNAELNPSASILPTTASTYNEISSTIYDPNSVYVCASSTMARVSIVKFIIPAANYEASAIATISIKASSTGPALAPSTISENVSFTFPNNYYTGSPAIISVSSDPIESSFFVATECATCHSIHVICPNNGVFSYRLVGSSAPYTILNLSFSGTPLSIYTAPGTYEYTCTLSYNFGNSLPQTGTFTVN